MTDILNPLDDLKVAIAAVKTLPHDTEEGAQAVVDVAKKAWAWVQREMPTVKAELEKLFAEGKKIYDFHGIGPWLSTGNKYLGGQMPIEVLVDAVTNPQDAIVQVLEAAAQDAGHIISHDLSKPAQDTTKPAGRRAYGFDGLSA